jgi:hypothetical protein
MKEPAEPALLLLKADSAKSLAEACSTSPTENDPDSLTSADKHGSVIRANADAVAR